MSTNNNIQVKVGERTLDGRKIISIDVSHNGQVWCTVEKMTGQERIVTVMSAEDAESLIYRQV